MTVSSGMSQSGPLKTSDKKIGLRGLRGPEIGPKRPKSERLGGAYSVQDGFRDLSNFPRLSITDPLTAKLS